MFGLYMYFIYNLLRITIWRTHKTNAIIHVELITFERCVHVTGVVVN